MTVNRVRSAHPLPRLAPELWVHVFSFISSKDYRTNRTVLLVSHLFQANQIHRHVRELCAIPQEQVLFWHCRHLSKLLEIPLKINSDSVLSCLNNRPLLRNCIAMCIRNVDHAAVLQELLLTTKKDPSGLGFFCIGYAYQHGILVNHCISKAISWYRKADEQGSPDACFSMGKAYEKGVQEGDSVVVPQDFATAASYFHKATLLEHPGAYFRLGLLWLSGAVPGVQRQIAEQMIGKAAQLEEEKAQLFLGNRPPGQVGTLETGSSNWAAKIRSPDGMTWLQHVALRGNKFAACALGLHYLALFQTSVSVYRMEDTEELQIALLWLFRAAISGNTEAFSELKKLSYSSQAAKKYMNKYNFCVFAKSAQGKLSIITLKTEAIQKNMGQTFYQRGCSLWCNTEEAQDKDQAVKYWAKALFTEGMIGALVELHSAEESHSAAGRHLGLFYQTLQEEVVAVNLLQNADAKGDSIAPYILAPEKLQNNNPDAATAEGWFQAALQKYVPAFEAIKTAGQEGSPEALYVLGKLTISDIGHSPKEAIVIWTKAVEKGHQPSFDAISAIATAHSGYSKETRALAYFNLARAIGEGWCHPQDDDKACSYLAEAMTLGHAEAKQVLTRGKKAGHVKAAAYLKKH